MKKILGITASVLSCLMFSSCGGDFALIGLNEQGKVLERYVRSDDYIQKVGEFLKGLNLELNVLPQIEKAKNKKEANETLTLIFYVDAICHQTRNFEGEINGKYARGWDYLLLVL